MKRLILLAGMLLVSVVAQAEWVKVAEPAGPIMIIYVESTSLRKTEDGIRYTSMMDYRKNPNNFYDSGNSSIIYREEVDCVRERKRRLSEWVNKKAMGEGESTYSPPSMYVEWTPVDPNVSEAKVMQYVCAQKVPR